MLNLQGITLKGFFQRNPEAVAEDLKRYRKDPSIHSDEVLKRIERDQTSYDFEMEIFHYDPKTGLFIAKGFDEAGSSGICGATVHEHIVFSKAYSRGEFHADKGETLFDQALRRFNYTGAIQNSSDPFSCQGTYNMPGHGEHMNGTWELTQHKE